MTTDQKLNQILEFIVKHPDRNNINPNTIQDIIKQEPIALDEAQFLHRKLMVSGVVRVVGSRYLAYSYETLLFLNHGGFGGEYQKKEKTEEIQEIKASMPEHPDELQISKVFISYAWGEEADQLKVLSFTNELRQHGFHAEIDKMISQRGTVPNFKAMMVTAMQYDKVVVVLSEKYKTKADQFLGGVGTEFKLMISEMDKQPNKYILVSFNGRADTIIPFALQEHDIVDLSNPEGWETLLRKLTDQPKYFFAEVAAQKPVLIPVEIPPFKVEREIPVIPPQPIANVPVHPTVERYALRTNLSHFKFNRLPNQRPILVEWYRLDLAEDTADEIRGFTYQELEQFQSYAVGNTINFGGNKNYRIVSEDDIPDITEYDGIPSPRMKYPTHLALVPHPEISKGDQVSEYMEILLTNENGISQHDYKLPFGVIGKILSEN